MKERRNADLLFYMFRDIAAVCFATVAKCCEALDRLGDDYARAHKSRA